jgi:penicillin-binding protein 2
MNLKLARYFFGGLVALCLLFEPLLMSFSAIRTTPSSSSTTKRTSKTKRKASKKTTPTTTKLTKSTVAKRRRGRIRVVDPTIGDVVDGEDLTVRRASVEGLGHIDGSVVVADPSNGRILSIVNQKLALGSAYQPCSTFKLLVSLAGLSEGVFSKDSEFKCPTHHRGYLNLTDALAYSCNEYFQNVGERLGFDRVKRYAQQFGFGELAGLDIKGERSGYFPSEIDEEWVRKLSSHGQFIEVTPLEMTAFVSSLANGGTLYYLQYPRSEEEVANFEPKIKRQLDISNLLPDLKEGMSGSVTYGSGKHAYDPLEPVYGKTGSCSGQGTHLGWFVSYAGDSEHQLVIVVLTRGSLRTEGPFAAGVAGRIYRELSQQKYFAKRDEKTNPTSVANDIDSPNNRYNQR